MTEFGDPSPQAALISVDYDPFVPPALFETGTTPAQLAAWKSYRSDPDGGRASKESLSLSLRGHIDESALALAIQTLPEFHEALRGHFGEDGAKYVIEPRVVVPIKNVDLSGMSSAEQAANVARLIAEDSSEPFKLETGPLFRATLVQRDALTKQVVLTAHSTACDGWSMDVLLADLARLYAAFRGDAAPPAPPHGYADYARNRGSEAFHARTLASRTYWQSVFGATTTPGYDIASNRAVSRPVCRWIGAVRPLPQGLVDATKGYARQQGLSYFSVLLSVFSVVLTRTIPKKTFCIAIPMAGHPEVAMEDCVGSLASRVPIKFQRDLTCPFDTHTRNVFRALLDANEHSSIDVSELASNAGLFDDSLESPTVLATFTHIQKYAPGKLSFAECEVDYDIVPAEFGSFDLALVAFESHDSVTLHLQVNAARYHPDWAVLQLFAFEKLLAQSIAVPSVTLESLLRLPLNLPTSPAQPNSPRGRDVAGARAPVTSSNAHAAPNSTGSASAVHNGYGDRTPIVVPLNAGVTNAEPIFCLFGIQLYVDLAKAFGHQTPVIAIHIPMPYVPSRDPRPELSDVVAAYVAAIQQERPEGPYRLAGLCYGGIVAYEVARSLRERGQVVSLVIVLDAPLPHARHVDTRKQLAHVVRNAMVEPGQTVQTVVARLTTKAALTLEWLPLAPKIRQGLAGRMLHRNANDPIDLSVTGYEAVADVARFEASRPYLDAPLLIFRATGIQRPPWETMDPDLGWSGMAASVKSFDIPSDHLSIVRAPHAQRVVDFISQELQVKA